MSMLQLRNIFIFPNNRIKNNKKYSRFCYILFHISFYPINRILMDFYFFFYRIFCYNKKQLPAKNLSIFNNIIGVYKHFFFVRGMRFFSSSLIYSVSKSRLILLDPLIY